MRRYGPFLAILFALATACRAPQNPGDPSIRMHTGNAGELGVSTEYGVVFLGRGERTGAVEFTVWFDDGPSLESGIIEPVGGDLFLTHAEIQLPIVPLTFIEPEPGTEVEVRGRRGRDSRSSFALPAVIARDDRVDGMLLEDEPLHRELEHGDIGAGVYVRIERERHLLGLISGRITFPGVGGAPERSYYTIVGPRELWRLVSYPRDPDQPRRRLQRSDVLP